MGYQARNDDPLYPWGDDDGDDDGVDAWALLQEMGYHQEPDPDDVEFEYSIWRAIEDTIFFHMDQYEYMDAYDIYKHIEWEEEEVNYYAREWEEEELNYYERVSNHSIWRRCSKSGRLIGRHFLNVLPALCF